MRLVTVMLALLFCLDFALGQSPQGAAPSPAPPAPGQAQRPARRGNLRDRAVMATPDNDPSKKVQPNAVVITIGGLCAATAPKPKTGTTAAAEKRPACPPTTVTKAQLERIIESVRPNLPATQRLALAQQYVQLLVVANAASKAGLDKDPRVQEELQLQKLQILASVYSKDMAQKSSEIPDAEIEKYYNEHHGQYQQLKLQRIYIPAATAAEGKPADEAGQKAVAEKIQKRAAAGEDFEKLQKEAFEAMNNKNTPPSVDMGERRRGSLPPKQEAAVFDLNPGDVSPVYEETSGAYIYKVVSKEVLPLDKVKDEIKSSVGRDRFREKMDKLKAGVQPVYNPAYFGGLPGMTPSVGGAPHPITPGAPPSSAAPTAVPQAPPAPASQSPATPAAGPGSTAQPVTPSGNSGAPQTPPPAPPASK